MQGESKKSPDTLYGDIEASFAYCTRLATEHYENFPVGSWMIPKNKRRYIHAIYAFARTADDFADEKTYEENDRLKLLGDWQYQLESCVDGSPKNPIFIALKETIARFGIPVELLKDLITAFKMDTVNKSYRKMEDVLNYCRYSANPVGRIVLYLFGYKDPGLHRLSDFICTALQLTNFWQDIAIDLVKDRIYIPLEDMEKYGYTEEKLMSHVLNDNFKNMLTYEIEFTKGLFMKGLPLCSKVEGGLSLELKAVWSGGMKILEKIGDNDYDMFNKRPVINIIDKVKIVTRALTMRQNKNAEYS